MDKITRSTDLTGWRFGRLTVHRLEQERSPRGQRRWFCICDCGGSTIALTENLTRGHTRSCGCLWDEQNITHGNFGTPEYTAWSNMIQRCENPNNPMFKYYGGRGVTIDPRWRASYEAFIADMGIRPTEQHSLERRDVDGNYEPNNCYWATPDVQMNNRQNSVRHTIEGRQYTEREIHETFGVSSSLLRSRMDSGLTAEEAVKKPVRSWSPKSQ